MDTTFADSAGIELYEGSHDIYVSGYSLFLDHNHVSLANKNAMM